MESAKSTETGAKNKNGERCVCERECVRKIAWREKGLLGSRLSAGGVWRMNRSYEDCEVQGHLTPNRVSLLLAI